jgi:predicted ester cyclase
MAEGAALITRFYDEVLSGGNLGLVDELTADNFVDHEEGLPGQPAGKEGVAFFVRTLREAFPDIRATVDVTLSDGDLEAVRGVVTGTHQGDFMEVSATNKAVEFEVMDIVRVEDGKAAEHWGLTDVMGLMQQLGALPTE